MLSIAVCDDDELHRKRTVALIRNTPGFENSLIREFSRAENLLDSISELMSQDELAVLGGGKCILQLRGVRPFLSDKYDVTQHPNYKYLSDANPKNAFDVEKYLSTRLKLRPEEEFEVFEADVSETQAPA